MLAPALVPAMCPCPVTAAPTWKPFEALSGAVGAAVCPRRHSPAESCPGWSLHGAGAQETCSVHPYSAFGSEAQNPISHLRQVKCPCSSQYQ